VNGVSNHGRGRAENDVKKSHHGWGGEENFGCWILNFGWPTRYATPARRDGEANFGCWILNFGLATEYFGARNSTP
jgi:hypothetical protein